MLHCQIHVPYSFHVDYNHVRIEASQKLRTLLVSKSYNIPLRGHIWVYLPIGHGVTVPWNLNFVILKTVTWNLNLVILKTLNCFHLEKRNYCAYSL